MKKRTFKVIDIDAEILVEPVSTRKEIFDWMSDFLDNLGYEWFSSDDTFAILYDDGTEDYIDSDYDGHKIRKQHIVSMVYSNDCSYITYGAFEMNEYGVVSTSTEENISKWNIEEVA